MQVKSIEAVQTNAVTSNNKVVEAKVQAQDVTTGYEDKTAAPTDAGLYKAMYGVADKTAQSPETKTSDEDAYKKAMGDYLLKWGTDAQIREFFGDDYFKPAAKTAPVEETQTEAPKKNPYYPYTNPDDMEFETPEDREYYEQYVAFKLKYE